DRQEKNEKNRRLLVLFHEFPRRNRWASPCERSRSQRRCSHSARVRPGVFQQALARRRGTERAETHEGFEYDGVLGQNRFSKCATVRELIGRSTLAPVRIFQD